MSYRVRIVILVLLLLSLPSSPIAGPDSAELVNSPLPLDTDRAVDLWERSGLIFLKEGSMTSQARFLSRPPLVGTMK